MRSGADLADRHGRLEPDDLADAHGRRFDERSATTSASLARGAGFSR